MLRWRQSQPPTLGPSHWNRSMGPPGTDTFTLSASKSLPTWKFPVWSFRDKATNTKHITKEAIVFCTLLWNCNQSWLKKISHSNISNQVFLLWRTRELERQIQFIPKNNGEWINYWQDRKHDVLFFFAYLTLAPSQCGQSEHLLKGECVIFWVLDAQEFGWVHSSPHSIQHRGWVATRHIWHSITNGSIQQEQADTCTHKDWN